LLIKKTKRVLLVFLTLLLSPNVLEAQEVLEIWGKDVPGLVGQPIPQLRLYASKGEGKIQVIPFQIDEKSSQKKVGRSWALKEVPGGPKTTPGDQIFEGDEVLLFYRSDGGLPLEAANFHRAKKVWEIPVNSSGYQKVYLCLEEMPKDNPPKTGLRYDLQNDRVISDQYEVGFSKSHPIIQDLIIIKNAAVPQDILDRFKARFDLAVKHFFDFKFDEGSIRSRLVGYREGPIRIIRRVVASKSLGPIRLIPKTKIDFEFYEGWIDAPSRINNPVNGPKVLEEKTQGLSGFDFNSNLYGSDFYTNLKGAVIRLDGIPEKEARQTSGSQFKWLAFSGVAGSMILEIKNDRKLKQLGIYPALVLVDDKKRANPPESELGEVYLGFDLPYHKIPKGNYLIRAKQVYPKDFKKGKERVYLWEARVQRIREAKEIS